MSGRNLMASTGTGADAANGQEAQENAGHDLAGLFHKAFVALDMVASVVPGASACLLATRGSCPGSHARM